MQSGYIQTLLKKNPALGQRYLSKIQLIDNLDPFSITHEELDYSAASIPPVTFPDLFSYFVLTHSFYTNEQMKAYKSLEAHKNFSAGFVLKVGCKVVNDFYVMVGKVKHSQKSSAKPLDSWCLITKDGTISNSHCTCMAGESEVCSHIGALLFAAEYANRKKDTIPCTDVAALWPMPSLSTEIPIVPISEMDFGSAANIPPKQHVPPLSKKGVVNLLKKIEGMGRSASIARIVEPFASKIQSQSNVVLPDKLSIFDEKYIAKSYAELMKVSRRIDISVTKEEASLIERHTRDQHGSSKWYKQRAGRITASKLKEVCKTNKELAWFALVRSICYPEKNLLKTKATEWGLKHISSAVQQYQKYMEEEHEDFIVKDVGLMISSNWPQLAASPDRTVFCKCCLGGVLEVKCPYLLYVNDIKDIKDYVNLKNSCLTMDGDKITLKRDHSYYFQIQMQIFVSGSFLGSLQYCDFVIWSPKIFFQERILADFDFWEKNRLVALKVHKEVIMPELLGRYFSRQEDSAKLNYWCSCKGVDDGTPMICCDNDECEIKWFHYKCVGLSVNAVGTSQWFCDSCKSE